MRTDIAIAPDPNVPGQVGRSTQGGSEIRHERARESVVTAGGKVMAPEQAGGLVWLNIGDIDLLSSLLDANPGISWVQLMWAGVDSFLDSDLFQRPVTFTCAKGAFAEQVAEHALMLILASLRHVTEQARQRAWHGTEPTSLHDKRVTILGGGGIATVLTRLLRPMRCRVVVVRRRPDAVDGAHETLPVTALQRVLPETDVLVLALALTPETRHIIGASELALLPRHAVVVNVARGGVIDTAALWLALKEGRIAAAGLDVTDPEPLPADHPLWALDNVLITSHCADSVEYVTERLAARIEENVKRFIADEPLVGVVNPEDGY